MANSLGSHARCGMVVGGIAALVAGSLLVACGSSTASSPPNQGSSSATTVVPKTTSVPVEDVAIKIETGKMDGKSGWPRFTPADVNVQKGAAVTLAITNYDDGPAPLSSALAMYEQIAGGTEEVDGTAVTSIPNAQISHTFSVPDLGVNVVIPAVPEGKKSVFVTFKFTPQKTGTFVWHCFAPCGSGSDGMTGAMSTMNWMQGNLTVS